MPARLPSIQHQLAGGKPGGAKPGKIGLLIDIQHAAPLFDRFSNQMNCLIHPLL
jgi:hypothetical protein